MSSLNLAANRRAVVLRAFAALVIVVGYVDLARGGDVLAPIALVAGYVVLVPLALLVR